MFADLVIILIIRVFQFILRVFPESLRHFAGTSMGRIAHFLLYKRRKVAEENVKTAFPSFSSRAQKGIVLQSFKNLGVNFVELLMVPLIPKEKYKDRFILENRRNIEDAFDQGRGVIALVFHFANWEIMGVASEIIEKNIVVLARPLKRHQLLNAYLNRLRESTGLTIIPNAETAMDVMRFLKEKNIVAFLSDQREKRSRAVYVDFFGRKAPTSKGIVMIAVKTGAPMIPVYLVREGFLRYRVCFGEPIFIERKGKVKELLLANTRKINAYLEDLVRKYPDEWFWVHRRWERGRR